MASGTQLIWIGEHGVGIGKKVCNLNPSTHTSLSDRVPCKSNHTWRMLTLSPDLPEKRARGGNIGSDENLEKRSRSKGYHEPWKGDIFPPISAHVKGLIGL